eukprot:GHVN01024449.1.p1 GENE.GHVN01024449.1~~GHVN01024449.1.p1  ORF type:complete len:584 (+),score=89.82 GHVN01024449.1:88-1839(+)
MASVFKYRGLLQRAFSDTARWRQPSLTFTNRCAQMSTDSTRHLSPIVAKFATVNPDTLSGHNIHQIQQLVSGSWVGANQTYDVVDPMNGEVFARAPLTSVDELEPFLMNIQYVPKSGTHNLFKNPERFRIYGKVFHTAAALLHNEEVINFFSRLIQRTMPKSYAQALAEMQVIRAFLENYSGDRVRMMMRGFTQAGDYSGQVSSGYRWPYGSVAVISPYNFPLEIPIMQALGALMVGNRVTLKTESTQGLPVEQFIRFLHYCGLPMEEMDFISCRGDVMSSLIKQAYPSLRMLQFTGGEEAAETLNEAMRGRIRVEDAGFDWKLMGQDVPNDPKTFEYIAWQCDQDAYAIGGQKCSAQSMLVLHSNWVKAGFIDKLAELAKRRKLDDLSISPILAHTTEQIQGHVDALLGLPGSKLLFGGSSLKGHSIPKKYGAYEPTAVFVPLSSITADPKSFEIATTELFGPVQVITEWSSYGSEEGGQNDFVKVLDMFEHMHAHLTAAVVSRDPQFINLVMGNTVNGTTYAGLRARTTGAPQNHWFGPAGSPMAAGIGTDEAILQTWTCHREIVNDDGPVPESWTLPPPT